MANDDGWYAVDSHDRMVDNHHTDTQYTVNPHENPWNVAREPDGRDLQCARAVADAHDVINASEDAELATRTAGWLVQEGVASAFCHTPEWLGGSEKWVPEQAPWDAQ